MSTEVHNDTEGLDQASSHPLNAHVNESGLTIDMDVATPSIQIDTNMHINMPTTNSDSNQDDKDVMGGIETEKWYENIHLNDLKIENMLSSPSETKEDDPKFSESESMNNNIEVESSMTPTSTPTKTKLQLPKLTEIMGRDANKVVYKDLRAICGKLGIRGYKNKKKDYVLQLLAAKKMNMNLNVSSTADDVLTPVSTTKAAPNADYSKKHSTSPKIVKAESITPSNSNNSSSSNDAGKKTKHATIAEVEPQTNFINNNDDHEKEEDHDYDDFADMPLALPPPSSSSSSYLPPSKKRKVELLWNKREQRLDKKSQWEEQLARLQNQKLSLEIQSQRFRYMCDVSDRIRHLQRELKQLEEKEIELDPMLTLDTSKEIEVLKKVKDELMSDVLLPSANSS